MTNKEWKKFFQDLTPPHVEDSDELYDAFFDQLNNNPEDALKFMLLVSGLSDADRGSFMMGALFQLAAMNIQNESYIKQIAEEAVKVKTDLLNKKVWN